MVKEEMNSADERNRYINLCLCKLGYKVLALLSSDIYILSGGNLAGVYSTTRCLRDQNTTQVDNRGKQAVQGRDPIRPIAPSSSIGFHEESKLLNL
jgi:hypothetical protein